MNVIVRCHSGFRFDEKPLSFHWEGDDYQIKRIVAEWKTVLGHTFTVITESDRVFELSYDEFKFLWSVKPLNQ